MEIWIEDAGGVKQGGGPLITAASWTQTDRLNAAGEFAFSLPALDPRAALVRPKAYARAWQCEPPAGWREVGYGRIERVSTVMGADGRPQLNVTGVTELGLLVDRLCHNMTLRREVQAHPAEVYGSGANLYQGTYDYGIGDTTTADVLDHGGDIFIRANQIFHKITFVVSTPHANASVAAATYWDTQSETWASLDIVDGTSAAGVAFAQSGAITFDPPSGWGIEPGKTLYELKLTYTGAISAVSVADITVWYFDGTPDALTTILSYAPPGWSLDTANGYGATEQRALGADILTNSGFETHTGTADDATTDTFTGWTNNGANDGAGRSILAVTSAHGGGHAVKLTSDSGANYAYLTQEATVTPGQQYTLKFWCKGDAGVGQMRCILTDTTSGGSGQELLSYDSQTTGAAWAEHSLTLLIPAGLTALTLRFDLHYNTSDPAAAYLDDVTLQAGGRESVYLQLRDETVLEALRRVAALTSENFIRSPAGRQVLWLGADVRDSELRAVAADPVAGYSIPNALLLTDLTELEDAAGLVSRVYAYGGGMGANRVTLADVTQPIPAGYVLDRTNNYLERTAAVAALGVVETAQQWADIVPADQSATQAQYAANALMWQAWNYLETHSATDTDRVYGDIPRFYRASVVKVERDVLPGYTLRLSYHRFRDGVHAINIERDCWITAVTQSVSDAGAHVVGLELATVPRAAENDNLLLARNLIRLRDVSAHNSAEGY